MSRRPSFQFYPADHLSDEKLQFCTWEEKGVWIHFCCMAHFGEPYGVLRHSVKDLARAINCKPTVLESLIARGVLSGADVGQMCAEFTYTPYSGHKAGPTVTLLPEQPGPLLYCKRMVRDEYVRQNRGKGSRFTAGEESPNPPPPKPPPKPTFGEGQGDGSSSSSSSSSKRGDFGPTETAPTPPPILVNIPCQEGKLFGVTQAMVDRWKVDNPGVDVLEQINGLRKWAEANPAKRKAISGAFSWVGNCIASARKPPPKINIRGKARSEAEREYLDALGREAS